MLLGWSLYSSINKSNGNKGSVLAVRYCQTYHQYMCKHNMMGQIEAGIGKKSGFKFVSFRLLST